MPLLFISFAFAAVVTLFIVLLFFVPKSNRAYSIGGTNVDPGIAKLVKLFGSDVLALTPDSIRRKQSNNKSVANLIKRSGNPWNITVRDFFVIRVVLAFLGLVFGFLFGFLMLNIAETSLFLMISPPLMLLLGWMYPKAHYTSLANKRDIEFKKTLPQSIDLLIMALSGGGYTLQNAIEEVLKYMDDSPVKEEFFQITQDVKSGITLSEALNNFADRVSTDSIQSFVRALNNAQRLSVPMLDILEARATASRKELRAEAELRIQKLPTKVMLVLSPTSAISVATMAVAPSLLTIMKFMH